MLQSGRFLVVARGKYAEQKRPGLYSKHYPLETPHNTDDPKKHEEICENATAAGRRLAVTMATARVQPRCASTASVPPFSRNSRVYSTAA